MITFAKLYKISEDEPARLVAWDGKSRTPGVIGLTEDGKWFAYGLRPSNGQYGWVMLSE